MLTQSTIGDSGVGDSGGSVLESPINKAQFNPMTCLGWGLEWYTPVIAILGIPSYILIPYRGALKTIFSSGKSS